MLVARPETSLLCEQSTYGDLTWVHCHRDQISSCSLGDGEVSSLPVHKSLHPGNRSKAMGSHIVQKSKPSNT